MKIDNQGKERKKNLWSGKVERVKEERRQRERETK